MHLFRRTRTTGLVALAAIALVTVIEPLPAGALELPAPLFKATTALGAPNDTLSAGPVAPGDTPAANGAVGDFITRNNQPQIAIAAASSTPDIALGDCVQLLRALVVEDPATPGTFVTGAFGIVAAAARTTATSAIDITDTNAGLLAGRVPDGSYLYRFQVRRGWSLAAGCVATTVNGVLVTPTNGTLVHTSGVLGTTSMPIVIDTFVASPKPDLLPVSDSGIAADDNITNPAILAPATGTGSELVALQLKLDHPESGVKVDLHRTGNKLTATPSVGGATVADLRNGATFPTTSGQYGYTATWVDRAGNVAVSVLTVTMDYDNPLLPAKLDLLSDSDSGISNADDITNDTTPTFTVSGAENDATVFLYRCNGAAACTTTSRTAVLATRVGNGPITAPETPQNTTTPIGLVPAVTSWRFTVTQQDLSGRFSGGPAPATGAAGMAVNINVVIDATKEAVPAVPTLLDSSQTGSLAGPNRTSSISPTFNVAKGTGRVELLRDGAVVGVSVGAGDITDPGPLANGTYLYTARSTDTAGNVSGESAATAVSIANSEGYWLLGRDGGVFSFGNAEFFGSTGDLTLNAPVMSMATTPKKDGYWLLARDGGVFSFGNVDFYGSTGDLVLNSPIAGMVPTSTGKGYWLFAEDGGVFAFGDAPFSGSPAGQSTDSPVVAMVAALDNKGYWLVNKKGKVFAFGSASSLTGVDNIALNFPIVGMAGTPSGGGLWLVASDGGIFALGDAAFHGSAGNIVLNKPIIGMLTQADGAGYLLIASDGGVFAYGNALFLGSTGGQVLNAPIVGIAGT